MRTGQNCVVGVGAVHRSRCDCSHICVTIWQWCISSRDGASSAHNVIMVKCSRIRFAMVFSVHFAKCRCNAGACTETLTINASGCQQIHFIVNFSIRIECVLWTRWTSTWCVCVCVWVLGGRRQLFTRSHYKLRRRHRDQKHRFHAARKAQSPIRNSHWNSIYFVKHLLCVWYYIFGQNDRCVALMCSHCVAIETHYRHTVVHTRARTHTHTHTSMQPIVPSNRLSISIKNKTCSRHVCSAEREIRGCGRGRRSPGRPSRIAVVD